MRLAHLVHEATSLQPGKCKIHGLLEVLRLAGVVVGRPRYHLKSAFHAAAGVEEHARMWLRHRVVGGILKHEEGDRHISYVLECSCLTVIDRPLREPRAQSGIARDTGGTEIDKP